jgi:hypothetical protein
MVHFIEIRKGGEHGVKEYFREPAGERPQEIHGVLFEARVQL